MKKFLVLASILLVLTLVFVACTGDDTPDVTDGETTVANDPVTDVPTEAPEVTEEPTEAPVVTEEPTETPTDKPEDPTEAPPDGCPTDELTEAPTADPAEPVWIIEPEAINTLAQSTEAVVAQQIVSSEVITEGNYTFVRLIANGKDDPYVAIIPLSSNYTMPNYLAVKYRTNSEKDGQFFMGSGQGWNGQGDFFGVDWNQNAEWNLMIVDITTTGLTSVTDGKITYTRFDFFAGASAEGDYIDIEYIAFFNTAEYAEAYEFAKHPPYIEADDAAAGKVANSFDTFYVNGQMYFEQDGGAGDKLTAINNTIPFEYEDVRQSLALRGWIGFGQPIASFGYFVDNYQMVWGEFTQATEDGVKAAGGEHASRFQIDVPLADLETGTHTIGFVVKLEDGTVVRLRENLTVIIVPYHENEIVQLADRNNSVTPICTPSDKLLGQKFTVTEGFLKQITVADMATYADKNENTWTFKVWQWKGDYISTVESTPVFVTSGENHQDNRSMVINIPSTLMLSGEIFYEVEYLTGSGGFTGWTAEGYVAEGLESYIAGNKISKNFASSILVGIEAEMIPEEIPEHQIQNAPVYIIKAKDMILASPNQVSMEKMDGYNHFTPSGPDPNFMLFNNQTGSRFVAIKYRTEYHANLQIYLGSTGAGPTDDSSMLQDVLISDGEWHLLIFDTQELTERGVYDGSTAAYLRFDVMEAGYMLDDNGQPWRDQNGTWQKEPLPNGATIDIAYFAFFETAEKANGYEYGGSGDNPETPVEPESYDVPQSVWTVSGHCPQIVGKEGHGNSPMVAAGGIDSGALLHQGSVGVGEIDLSKYSKVIIKFGIDNSQVTLDHYNTNANNRIMLVNADVNMVMSPAAEQVIADANYTPQGWALVEIEIDLTGVNYNGPVYVTYDTLPGTFMLIGSIEFVA